MSLPVTAPVAEKLLASVLLGTDIPELGKLMNQPPQAQPDTCGLKPADRLKRRLGTSRSSPKSVQAQWMKPIRSPPWMLICSWTLESNRSSHVERNARHDTATASSERRMPPDTCGERQESA